MREAGTVKSSVLLTPELRRRFRIAVAQRGLSTFQEGYEEALEMWIGWVEDEHHQAVVEALTLAPSPRVVGKSTRREAS